MQSCSPENSAYAGLPKRMRVVKFLNFWPCVIFYASGTAEPRAGYHKNHILMTYITDQLKTDTNKNKLSNKLYQRRLQLGVFIYIIIRSVMEHHVKKRNIF